MFTLLRANFYDYGQRSYRKHSPNSESYTVRGLNYQLKQLCRHNREGSFGTQVQRERELTLIANQLHDLGYRCMNQRSLKPKHI